MAGCRRRVPGGSSGRTRWLAVGDGAWREVVWPSMPEYPKARNRLWLDGAGLQVVCIGSSRTHQQALSPGSLPGPIPRSGQSPPSPRLFYAAAAGRVTPGNTGVAACAPVSAHRAPCRGCDDDCTGSSSRSRTAQTDWVLWIIPLQRRGIAQPAAGLQPTFSCCSRVC